MPHNPDIVVTVAPGGVLTFIHSDEAARILLPLGAARIRRASHVEPTADCRWTADMSPVAGPVLGPFDTRELALSAEVAWLQTELGL